MRVDKDRRGSEYAIRVEGLCKSYGKVRALAGVSFAVRRGELFGYLGPNGAGKTTTIRILSCLLKRDGGYASVCGLDVEREPLAVKQRIGVVPEESNLYPELGCRRNLEYLGELYGLSRRARRSRAAELLSMFELSDRADMRFGALSRGLKRRLTVAAALIHSPEVLFLDEPTAGLDVQSARNLRSHIKSINRAGTTVFLTTHNLAEAESLCSRVLILIRGRVVTEGKASQIGQRFARTKRLSVVLSDGVSSEELLDACPAVKSASLANGTWSLIVSDTDSAVWQISSFARGRGIRIVQIASALPSLEDAFLSIVEGDNKARALGR